MKTLEEVLREKAGLSKPRDKKPLVNPEKPQVPINSNSREGLEFNSRRPIDTREKSVIERPSRPVGTRQESFFESPERPKNIGGIRDTDLEVSRKSADPFIPAQIDSKRPETEQKVPGIDLEVSRNPKENLTQLPIDSKRPESDQKVPGIDLEVSRNPKENLTQSIIGSKRPENNQKSQGIDLEVSRNPKENLTQSIIDSSRPEKSQRTAGIDLEVSRSPKDDLNQLPIDSSRPENGQKILGVDLEVSRKSADPFIPAQIDTERPISSVSNTEIEVSRIPKENLTQSIIESKRPENDQKVPGVNLEVSRRQSDPFIPAQIDSERPISLSSNIEIDVTRPSDTEASGSGKNLEKENRPDSRASHLKIEIDRGGKSGEISEITSSRLPEDKKHLLIDQTRGGELGHTEGPSIVRPGESGDTIDISVKRPRVVEYKGTVNIERAGTAGKIDDPIISRPGSFGVIKDPLIIRPGDLGTTDEIEIKRPGDLGTTDEPEIERSGDSGTTEEIKITRSGESGIIDKPEIERPGDFGVSSQVIVNRPGIIPGILNDPIATRSGESGTTDEPEIERSGDSGTTDEPEIARSGDSGTTEEIGITRPGELGTTDEIEVRRPTKEEIKFTLERAGIPYDENFFSLNEHNPYFKTMDVLSRISAISSEIGNWLRVFGVGNVVEYAQVNNLLKLATGGRGVEVITGFNANNEDLVAYFKYLMMEGTNFARIAIDMALRYAAIPLSLKATSKKRYPVISDSRTKFLGYRIDEGKLIASTFLISKVLKMSNPDDPESGLKYLDSPDKKDLKVNQGYKYVTDRKKVEDLTLASNHWWSVCIKRLDNYSIGGTYLPPLPDPFKSGWFPAFSISFVKGELKNKSFDFPFFKLDIPVSTDRPRDLKIEVVDNETHDIRYWLDNYVRNCFDINRNIIVPYKNICWDITIYQLDCTLQTIYKRKFIALLSEFNSNFEGLASAAVDEISLNFEIVGEFEEETAEVDQPFKGPVNEYFN